MTDVKASATQRASEANQKNSEDKIKNKINAIKAIISSESELKRLRKQWASMYPNRKKITLSERWFAEWKGLDAELATTGRNMDTYDANKDDIKRELASLREALKSPSETDTSSEKGYKKKYNDLQIAQKIQFEDLLIEREVTNDLREQIARLNAEIKELELDKSELVEEKNELLEQNKRLKRARPSISVVKGD